MLMVPAQSKVSIEKLLNEVNRHPNFSVSPRYVQFHPSDALQDLIDDYLASGSTVKRLAELRYALEKTTDGFTAIAIVTILAQVHDKAATQALQTYHTKLRLRKVRITTPYPDRYAVLREVAAALPAKGK